MGGTEEAEPILARTLPQGSNFKGDQKEREIRKKHRDRVKEKRATDICFYEYI